MSIEAEVAEFSEKWGFTNAEKTELRFMLAGLTARESAGLQLNSHETVRGRRKVMYSKADIHDQGKMVATVMGLGLGAADVFCEKPGLSCACVVPSHECPECGELSGMYSKPAEKDVLDLVGN